MRQRHKEPKVAYIREELFAITKNLLRSVLLDFFIRCTSIHPEKEDFINEELGKQPGDELHYGWITVSYEEILSELGFHISNAVFIKHIGALTSNQFIYKTTVRMPFQPGRLAYRINAAKIEKDVNKAGYRVRSILSPST